MLGSGWGSPDPDHTVRDDHSVEADLASVEACLRAIAAQPHRPHRVRSPSGRRLESSLLRESERDQLSCHARYQGASGSPGTLFGGEDGTFGFAATPPITRSSLRGTGSETPAPTVSEGTGERVKSEDKHRHLPGATSNLTTDDRGISCRDASTEELLHVSESDGLAQPAPAHLWQTETPQTSGDTRVDPPGAVGGLAQPAPPAKGSHAAATARDPDGMAQPSAGGSMLQAALMRSGTVPKVLARRKNAGDVPIGGH